MPLAHVKIVNFITGKVVKDSQISPADPTRAASKFRDLNPDCTVTVTWNDGADFVMHTAKNMQLDELKVDEGLMSFEQFAQKWYSAPATEPEDVLVAQEEEEEYDPWANDQADPACDQEEF